MQEKFLKHPLSFIAPFGFLAAYRLLTLAKFSREIFILLAVGMIVFALLLTIFNLLDTTKFFQKKFFKLKVINALFFQNNIFVRGLGIALFMWTLTIVPGIIIFSNSFKDGNLTTLSGIGFTLMIYGVAVSALWSIYYTAFRLVVVIAILIISIFNRDKKKNCYRMWHFDDVRDTTIHAENRKFKFPTLYLSLMIGILFVIANAVFFQLMANGRINPGIGLSYEYTELGAKNIIMTAAVICILLFINILTLFVRDFFVYQEGDK